MSNLVAIELIASKILIIRGKKVILDSDLATLYEVKTKRLNEQVARNRERFPEDFMFQLTEKEAASLRPHFATSKRGGRRYLPYVFTQEGVAMLSSVLNSERAIMVNIHIMRAFVQLRKLALTNGDLRRKVGILEKKYDKQFAVIFTAIKALLEPPRTEDRRVVEGFGKK